MFYSQNILTRKGKLGIICHERASVNIKKKLFRIEIGEFKLAATYKGPKNKYLTSKEVKRVNIIKVCDYIIHPTLPFALRLSSTLMLGVVRVYREQTRIILIEANKMVKAVRSAIEEKRLSKELQMPSPEQKRDSITLPLLLDYDMEFPECQEQIHTDHLVTFAKSDKYFRLPFVKSPQLQFPSPASTPEQKISTEEEKSPFQADRKDITLPEVDYTRTLDENILQVPGEVDIEEPFPHDDTENLRREAEKTPQKLGVSTLEFPEEGVAPQEEAGVMLFDENTGDLRPEATPTREVSEVPGPLGTPQVPIEQLELVSPPKKRKKRLAIDYNIKLTGKIMKKNFNDADSLKKKRPYAMSQVSSALKLFSTPATSVLSAVHFVGHWKSNAFVQPLTADDVQWAIDVPVDLTVSPVTSVQEDLSGLEESPYSGIEIPRLQRSEISSEFEQSTGINVTPDFPSLEKSRRSRDLSLSSERRVDVTTTTPVRRVSRPPPVGPILTPIIDEEREVEVLPPEEIEEPFVTEEEEIPADQRDEQSLETLSKIKRAMGGMSEIWFHDFLSLDTSRKQAALIFCHLMAFTKSGILNPIQREPFGDILIKRGPAY